MENNNRPEIRFVKSKERWLKKRLGEIAEINPKTVLPNKFNYVDLESVIGTELKGYRVETKESAPSRAQRLAQTGDIFYQTVRPYQKNNYLFNLDNEDFVFSTGYAQLRTSLNSYFLFTKIQDDRFVAKVLDQCTGTSYPAINANSLSNIEVYIPFDQYEEKSIGAYFENLDKTIAIQQQELKTLKQTKQGFLQKMFPKEGETIPEVRFEGFNEEWKETKIGEICNTSIGEFVIKTRQKPENPYPVYNGGISPTGYYDEYNNVGPKVIISARGANAGFVNYIEKPYWAGNSCYSVDLKDNTKFQLNYIFFYLKRHQHLFTDYQQAANIPSVSKKDVENFEISFPKPDEQVKIGEFFKKLDKTIELHEKELEALKETKKAFLQKMFV